MRILLVQAASDAELTKQEIRRAAIPSIFHVTDSPIAFGQALRDFGPEMIVASHSPPRLDALESLRISREVDPNIPVIVMTGTVDQEMVVECLQSGAADVVRKERVARLGPALLAAIGLRHAREAKARSELALQESGDRFRLLAESIPGTLYLRRNDARYSMVYLNDAVEGLTGYSKESFLENTVALGALCHPQDRLTCDAEIDRAIASRAPFHLVYRLRHRTRGWRWVEEHGAGVHRDGALAYVEGLLTDITDRRRIEQRTEQQRDWAQSALASIGHAVITADTKGRIEFMNPAAEQLTGWRGAEAGGRPITDVVKTVGNGNDPVDHPVARCVREDRIVGVTENVVMVHRHGSELAIHGSAAPVRDANGKRAGAVVVFHDATRGRARAKQLAYEATHDSLTGLWNRSEFERRLERAVGNAQTHLDHHTLCYLDLDRFKIVNDRHGHLAGDALLRQLGPILGAEMRARDTLARLGGDEFGVLLEHCSPEQARRVAANLLKIVTEFRLLWEDKTVSVGVSIGVAPISAQSERPTAVLEDADAACYAAKRRGGNCVHVFRADDLHLMPSDVTDGQVLVSSGRAELG